MHTTFWSTCRSAARLIGLWLFAVLLNPAAAYGQDRTVDAWKCVENATVLHRTDFDRQRTSDLNKAVDSLLVHRGIACPWVGISSTSSEFGPAWNAYDAGWRAVVEESRKYTIHVVSVDSLVVAVLTYKDELKRLEYPYPGQVTYFLYAGTDASAEAIVDALNDVAPIARTGFKGLRQPR